jgi:hypothetical protein
MDLSDDLLPIQIWTFFAYHFWVIVIEIQEKDLCDIRFLYGTDR